VTNDVCQINKQTFVQVYAYFFTILTLGRLKTTIVVVPHR